MRLLNLLLLGTVLISVIGCASYSPPKTDPETGRYKTTTSLEAGAVEIAQPVNLDNYRLVYLNTETNVYPARLEYFVRSALHNAGITLMFNQAELLNLVRDHEHLKASIPSITDPLSLGKLSDSAGPILMIYFKSQWDGDVRRYVSVEISDLSTGTAFLKINHPKLIWWEVDSEAHYPVLNEIADWIKDCRAAHPGEST